MSSIMRSKRISKAKNLEADVVVIGGGGTGFAAASAASEKGAKVLLLEKRRTMGGNSVFAHGLFAAESPVQKLQSIAALKDDIFKMAMDYSHWTINPRIFRALIEKSGDTIQWLENKGLKFGTIRSMYPGIDAPVFHGLEPPDKAGPTIVKRLREHCEKLGTEVLHNCRAKKIFKGKDGKVSGILAVMEGKEQRIRAKSIIIATGGYTGNKKLLKKHYPLYSEDIVFLGIPHTGDGLKMAVEAGAVTEGLGVMLLHPHYYNGSVRINTIAQEPSTMWVNKKGERFTSETVSFKAIECGNAVNRQLGKCNHVLFDHNILKSIEDHGFLRGGSHGEHEVSGVKLTNLHETLDSETVKGDVKISNSLKDIADWIGVLPEVLQNSVSEYNRFCSQGYDEIFNKERRYLKALKTPPYYAVRTFVACLDTIGGIKINHHMEVVDHHDNPIPGLYAGGDAAGGWESETYCLFIPGSAFGFAVNSGRIAGENASKYVKG